MKYFWLTGLLLVVFLVTPAQKECLVTPFVQKQQSCFRQIQPSCTASKSLIDLRLFLNLPEELIVHCLSYDPLGYAAGVLWSKIQLTQGGADILARALMQHVLFYKNEYAYDAHALFLKKIVTYLRYTPQKYVEQPDALYVKNSKLLLDALYKFFYNELDMQEVVELQRKKIFVDKVEDCVLSQQSFKRVVEATPAHPLALYYAHLVFKDGKDIDRYCFALKSLLPMTLFPRLSRLAFVKTTSKKICKTCWCPLATFVLCCGCLMLFTLTIYGIYKIADLSFNDWCTSEGQPCSCTAFCYRGTGICSYKEYRAECPVTVRIQETHKAKIYYQYYSRGGDRLSCYCPY